MSDDWQPGDLALVVGYNPLTGNLWWLQRPRELFKTEGAWRSWNAKWAGKAAFRKRDKHGYLTGKFRRRDLKAHRVAWFLHYGHFPPEGVIDHINGNPSDNRIANLRAVSHSENLRNAKRNSRNTSGITGVRRCGANRWQAAIWDGSRSLHLGTFATKEDAASARKAAEVRLNYHEGHGRPHTPDAEDAETIALLKGGRVTA